ncbi:hypothetical protein BFW87_01280 [Pseudomonas fluorescens]|uniref:Uncharacterized protein n=1 Tax=Pseudomonas fluorescens TaxID=294 RepID=A0A1T2ZAG3_PSEFL|nr:hypothetical protein BFW87_01280 [Pseudomonas fluorescens]
MSSRQEAIEAERTLVVALGSPEHYRFFIPEWEPVDSLVGLHWFRCRLWEGFDVAYEIDAQLKHVYFKCWEFVESVSP